MASLNRLIIGWANYFCLGPVSKAYRAVERHTRRRLRQWLCAKHKVQGAGTTRYPDDLLHEEFGLVRLDNADCQPSVGDSVSLLREPDAGNPPVRFDERDVETEHGSASEAPADERAGNR